MSPVAGQQLTVTAGVTEAGEATERWLTMLRPRLSDAYLEAVARTRKPLTPAERGWAELIASRKAAWEGEVPGLAAPFDPIVAPANVVIVLGNRGGPDAFVNDPAIGFDLAALHAAYGAPELPENADRVDRLFRHEYVHLLQKAWLRVHPFAATTPLQAALAEIWAEGLGNYHSLSARWRATEGRPSEAAEAALARLEPRFVSRLSALACATPADAADLTGDLTTGRFEEKWGALPAALWLEAEASRAPDALRRFVVAGPAGVWDLARRHLPDPLGAVLEEARLAAELCATGPPRP